jgi:NAD(P)H-nitrite reductase large subunit
VTDAVGRSNIAEVFAIGDGAAIGGARVALARGRLAGLAAARDLGFGAGDDATTRDALAQAEAFQRALWRIYAAPAFDPARIADETILCRCEEVCAGEIRAAISGGAVGPFVAGAVHDATGSYAIAWWICVGMTLLSIVAIWQASPGKVRAVAGRI